MKTDCLRNLVAVLATWGAATTALAADQVLFDFTGDFDLGRVVATDAQATKSADGSALRVSTGRQTAWPGVTLPAPGGHWDLSPFAQVRLKVRNPGADKLTVFCRVDNPGADGTEHCVTGSAAVGPGATATLQVPLTRASADQLGGKLFGMRGYPVAPGGPGTVEPRNLTQLLVFLSKPGADRVFEVEDIRAAGTYTPPTAWVTDADPFFPFIDTFGQYRHKDWPGKVKSLADLAAAREQETAQLAARPGPPDWDQYGGWAAGPQRQATGFFRTEKVNGKWWLVDPQGRLFFSHGLDCVRSLDTTPVAERESWFQDFPGKQPEFAEFLSRGYALKGHYAGQTPQCFAFGGANLARKYGPAWPQAARAVIHKRLRSWGINTIANWSDEATRLMRLTAYTDTIGSGRARMIAGSEGYWGKFPDVFDPGFAESLRRSLEPKRAKSAGDPWCIGYFSDNEMSWGDDLSLALGALKSPPDQPAKRAFLSDLKAKYAEIAKLNQAWSANYASWEALLASRQAPDQEKARADLAAFYTKAAEQYFRTVRDTLKAVAPHQLYLGCRFAWGNARAAAAAAKYCDVVSYNLYQRSVAEFKFNGGADVPLMIGEFHFGALDRGMFHTGLVPVADQEARALAYKDYVQGALRHPQFVGCHWFQYHDEPVTGRQYDEENYQIGFVDVADTPYAETVRACRDVGYNLYK
ncbi:MAG: beta-galactosidase [Verrucomicrobiota bacterium]|jgi:hypothetical protein